MRRTQSSIVFVNRSPFTVYENDRALGPAHSLAADIHELGHGRFLHWKGIGFIISSSDGTDPATNGRKYWVVLPQPHAGIVAELEPPFNKFQAEGFDYAVAAPALEDLADSGDDANRSPFTVYENDRALGPAHSRAVDIRQFGHGRFLHWKGTGFIISSSDGTDPATNGRKYWVVLPPGAATK